MNNNIKIPATNKVHVIEGAYSSAIYLTADSGKIIYRDKVDTVIGIKHPGIILGTDDWGTTWVIHNHYKNGRPEIQKWEIFAEGVAVFYDDRQVFYDTMNIIERAIQHWQDGQQYDWLRNNCQHFVNRVTRNEHASEAIDQIADGSLAVGGILAFIGAVTGEKALVNTGLGIAGIAGAAKLISRA